LRRSKCAELADKNFVHALYTKCWPSGFLVLSVLIFGLMVEASPVNAGIHACPMPSGGTIYQDRPCDEDARSPTAPVQRTRSELPTIGLHSSWFERPMHAGDRAFCDKRGCECGQLENKFEFGLAQAVADALYIDGNWHRLAKS